MSAASTRVALASTGESTMPLEGEHAGRERAASRTLLAQALRHLLAEGYRGLVLDLRSRGDLVGDPRWPEGASAAHPPAGRGATADEIDHAFPAHGMQSDVQ